MTAPTPTLAIVTKNTSEEIRIARTEFKGHHLIDVRVFGRFGGPAAVMMPTKKGLTIQVAQLPVLIEALRRAQAVVDGGAA